MDGCAYRAMYYVSQKDVLRLDRLFALSRHEHLIVEVAGVDHRCPRGNVFGDDGRGSDGCAVAKTIVGYILRFSAEK